MNLAERIINPNFGVLKIVTRTNGKPLPLVISPENGRQLYLHSLVSFARHLEDGNSLNYGSLKNWLEQMSNVNGKKDNFDFKLTGLRGYERAMSEIGLPGYNVTVRTGLRRGLDELYTKTHANGDLAFLADPFIQRIVDKGYRSHHVQIRNRVPLRA